MTSEQRAIVQPRRVRRFAAYRYIGDGVLPFTPDDMGYKYSDAYGCQSVGDVSIRFGEFLASNFPHYPVHTAHPGDWIVIVRNTYYHIECEVMTPDEFERVYEVVQQPTD